jgi:hypothetical protein
MQTSQGEPRADLACVPDADKSLVDFVATQIREVDVVDKIFIDVVDEDARLLVNGREDTRHLLRRPHDQKDLVALRRQAIVQDVERPRYVRMGEDVEQRLG